MFTFSDRSDAFDMNMSLNEHFKSLRVDDEIAKESEEPREQLDLSLKEGQTIKVCNVFMNLTRFEFDSDSNSIRTRFELNFF